MLIDASFFALSSQFGGSIFSGPIFDTSNFFSQQVRIELANKLQIKIDLVLWKHVLSPEQELEKTADALLSMCAVHWYLDGHACMQPQTARAICCDSPVLRLLLDFKTIEEYINKAGYLLKNIIKYGDLVRHDPHISSFLREYINPITRYAAFPNSTPTDMENNQKIVSEGLNYLFNRLTSRTSESIRYIMDKKLLQVVFPLTTPMQQLCEQYFLHHFAPPDDHSYPSNMSGPAFLAMFFIGAIVDQPEENKTSLIDGLKISVIHCQKNLKVTITTTIRILEMIPTTRIAWDDAKIECIKQRALEKRPSFETDVLLLIFQMWHVSDKQSNTSTVTTEANVNLQGFFSSSSLSRGCITHQTGIVRPSIDP